MSKTTEVFELAEGDVHQADNGVKFVVGKSKPDKYGDSFWCAGVVHLQQDFEPLRDHAQAYALGRALADNTKG